MVRSTRRKDSTGGYRRVLWPTDFSRLAQAGLPHAVRLAAQGDGELVILHVLPTLAGFAFPEMGGVAWDRLAEEARGTAERRLERLVGHLKAKLPQLHVHAVVVEGVAFDEIHRVARRLGCDLIVLATHGRTGLQHVLMGSVAENVVRRSPCPVLTVRPRGFAVTREPQAPRGKRKGPAAGAGR